jgi:NADPH2:quinone reductase
MKAISVSQHGGPEVLELVTLPTPEPFADQVLVKVLAAGVNYIDTYQRSGAYQMQLPFTPGMDGAGEVMAVGEQVTDIKVGDIVAWPSAAGSYAEYIAIAANRVVSVPAGLDPAVACASMLQGMTAHYLINDSYRVQSGTVALVHAAAGGVGLLLTQMISARGGTVIATASTREKLDAALAAGASHALDYDRFDEAVRELTDGQGVDVVYDGVGATTFERSLASLKRRGMLVLFGAASGPVPPVDLQILNRMGSLYITRPTLADYIVTRAELESRAGDIFSQLVTGRLSFKIGGSYSLERAQDAHRDLQSRKTSGKLVLKP